MGLRSTTSVTMTRITDLSTVLCSAITITARGEAARLRPDCLGTFSLLPGAFIIGRPVFKNHITGKLLGFTFNGFWAVEGDGKGDVIDDYTDLRSGSGSNSGICPADTLANEEKWNYRDSLGVLQESSEIIVTCATHSVTSSAPEEPTSSALEEPNIDDVMKFIEGEPPSKPATKSKKKKKSKAKVSKTTASLSDSNIRHDTAVEAETEAV